MRILLVEPPFHSFMHYDRWFYPTALAQLAAVAHAAGHEAVIYDADRYFFKDPANNERNVFIKNQHLYYDNVNDFNHHIWRHFRQTLERVDPDIVGISIYTCKLQSALNVLRLVREYNPAIKTCVGGAHVTAIPQSLTSCGDMDGIFCGYADITFPAWIANGCPRNVVEEDPARIDLTQLPYARRQALLFPEYYTARDLSMIMTSRGCSGRCTFCANSLMWSGRPRFRSSQSIIDELRELFEEWRIPRHILLGDGSFSDVPQEAKRVAGILKEFKVRWEASVRWMVNKDLLEYFISCGCSKVFVGMESGSDKVLKYMKKGCTKTLIQEKAALINSIGLEWQLCCVTGFPVETLKDMEETMELAVEINPTSISLNSLSPLPGTEVYKDISGMTPELAAGVNQLHPSRCFSNNMDIETYRDMFIKMTTVFDEYNARQKQAVVQEWINTE